MTQPRCSVIVPVFNDEKHIADCIRSVLVQTMQDFELIVVDDCSTDRTVQVVQAFDDPRVVLLRTDTNGGGGGAAPRNLGVCYAHSEYLFFTDADCVTDPTWLENGLKLFATGSYAGLEGKLYFISPAYRPSLADRVVENRSGGEYMTANMAYTRTAVLAAGLFDPSLKRYCDSDLAFKVLQQGSIEFAPEMVVHHAPSRWTPASFFHYAHAIRNDVVLFKRHGHWYNIHGRLYAPEKLLAMLFPPLVLGKLLFYRCQTRDDFLVFLLIYPRLVYERLLLWKHCLRMRVLII